MLSLMPSFATRCSAAWCCASRRPKTCRCRWWRASLRAGPAEVTCTTDMTQKGVGTYVRHEFDSAPAHLAACGFAMRAAVRRTGAWSKSKYRRSVGRSGEEGRCEEACHHANQTDVAERDRQPP